MRLPLNVPRTVTRRRGRLARFLRASDGVAAIEAALVTPFLVLLAAGIFEFGSVLYSADLVQAGVRDASRYLARMPDPAAAAAEARRLAVTGTTAAGGTARVRWWSEGQVQIALEQVGNPRDPSTGLRLYRGGDVITTVRVSTQTSYPGAGLLAFMGYADLPISASHEERHAGS